ncbi:MAG: hypothetical protein WA517_05395 [Candidatus Acidiferrum sp.]
MDTRFNFLDSPTRSLTEMEFLRPGCAKQTWEDALLRSQEPKLDTLEKLAHSFASPLHHVRPSPVEKSVLDAGQENALDLRTEISSERRSENVPALEFLKVFTASEPSSSSALHKSAGPGVARVERDQLEDGSISVSEYDASGKLIRGWVSPTGEMPAMMAKAILPDRIFGAHGPAPERVLLPSIFSRREVA